MEASLFDAAILIDVVLAFAVAEGIGLILWHRWTGSGLRPAAVTRMVLPGLCLMLALRAAVVGQIWPFLPMALTAALIAHAVDVWGRWAK